EVAAHPDVERVLTEVRDDVEAWLQVRDEVAGGARPGREDVVVVGLVELEARVKEELRDPDAERIELRPRPIGDGLAALRRDRLRRWLRGSHGRNRHGQEWIELRRCNGGPQQDARA